MNFRGDLRWSHPPREMSNASARLAAFIRAIHIGSQSQRAHMSAHFSTHWRVESAEKRQGPAEALQDPVLAKSGWRDLSSEEAQRPRIQTRAGEPQANTLFGGPPPNSDRFKKHRNERQSLTFLCFLNRAGGI